MTEDEQEYWRRWNMVKVRFSNEGPRVVFGGDVARFTLRNPQHMQMLTAYETLTAEVELLECLYRLQSPKADQ